VDAGVLKVLRVLRRGSMVNRQWSIVPGSSVPQFISSFVLKFLRYSFYVIRFTLLGGGRRGIE